MQNKINALESVIALKHALELSEAEIKALPGHSDLVEITNSFLATLGSVPACEFKRLHVAEVQKVLMSPFRSILKGAPYCLASI